MNWFGCLLHFVLFWIVQKKLNYMRKSWPFSILVFYVRVFWIYSNYIYIFFTTNTTHNSFYVIHSYFVNKTDEKAFFHQYNHFFISDSNENKKGSARICSQFVSKSIIGTRSYINHTGTIISGLFFILAYEASKFEARKTRERSLRKQSTEKSFSACLKYIMFRFFLYATLFGAYDTKNIFLILYLPLSFSPALKPPPKEPQKTKTDLNDRKREGK